MSKVLLVEALVQQHGISKVAAGEIVDTVIEVFTKQMKKEGNFAIPKIGTFQVSKRPARKGRNPMTGESLKIPAKNSVRFKASTVLKAAVAKTKV